MLRPTYYPARPQQKNRFKCSKDALIGVLMALNVFMFLIISFRGPPDTLPAQGMLKENRMEWNGGHPVHGQTGSCMCSPDKYCLCSPSLAIDLIMSSGSDVWVVRRKDTNQLACMGGFVQVGETVEDAVIRELKEETGLTLQKKPTLFGIYSDPRRDNRRHTVSIVYVVNLDSSAHPVAADDVKDVLKIPLANVEDHDFFADHRTILMDYARTLNDHIDKARDPSTGDFADDIARSLCARV